MDTIKSNIIPLTPKKRQLNKKQKTVLTDLQHSIDFNTVQKEKIKNDRQLLNKRILRLYRLKS